ncbi:IS1182 family transposase [Janthinobacterium sp. GMG2]|uniref:IS1182 family transposase n=1 Tax=Janthinobacterium sp. GMG2 TaxID=3096606 RepID=UPI0029F5CA94|nr:IS1182 family transposase [Janthinobacterium sp. GMG2]MDX8124219.1 IS1182 family transposase [Janthinobacterium sp. GMG2]
MMGRQETKRELFVLISLNEYVPEDHLLRAVDQYLDLSEFRESLAQSYSHTGRPSVDPELMARMLIIGYCYGIRSERRLCEEVGMNLAYRWFCRLGLKDKVPDHSSFSKNRHGRFRDHDVFRQLFDSVLRRCMAEGLVQGEGFANDASMIKADAQRQRSCSGDSAIDWGDPEQASRPVREYLAALDQVNPVPPKRISLTDPSATWTAAAGPAIFAYSTNYLIDLKAGMIVDVEASAVSKIAEVEATKTMINRVEEKFAIKPQRLVGDTNYGVAAMLGWLVDEKKIAPHVPVWDKSEHHDGAFSRTDFMFDSENNRYVCPAGKYLKPAQRSQQKNPFRYRASLYDCQACQLKLKCCPNMDIRKIDRSPHEPARDVARAIGKTDAYRQSRRERKKIEMLFAHLKRILKLGQLRLRGPSGAHDEFLLAATAQNLRRMAKKLLPPRQSVKLVMR